MQFVQKRLFNKSVIYLKNEILFIMYKGTGRANWRKINTLSTKCLSLSFQSN